MNSEIIIYYLLSNPHKIEEFGFREEYIIGNNSKLITVIYKELFPECKKVNQIIPLLEAEKLFLKSRYSSYRDLILNVLRNMYISGEYAISTTSEKDLDYYCKKIVGLGILTGRNLIQTEIQPVLSDITTTLDDIINALSIAVNNKKYLFPESKRMSIYADLFDKSFIKSIEEEKVETGILGFDKYLCGGFLKQTISSIMAATGKGKTTMLITLTSNILLLGYNVAFINLEMREQEFQFNIYSSLQDKYSYKEIRNNYNENNIDFVADLLREIKDKNIGHFVTLKNNSFESLSCSNIELYLKQIEAEYNYKFDIVFIDYIGLLTAYIVEKGMERPDQIMLRTMNEFKKMCERNNWAGVTAQLSNRGAIAYEGKMTSNNDITNPMNFVSGSHASTFELDNFISFQRVQDSDTIKISFDKHRQWSEIEEPIPFLMKYNSRQKKYVQTCEELENDTELFGYKNVVDLLHDKYRQTDIVNLCKKFNIGPATVDVLIRRYYSKKGYKAIKSDKPLDIDSIHDIHEFLNKFINKSSKLFPVIDLTAETLFN